VDLLLKAVGVHNVVLKPPNVSFPHRDYFEDYGQNQISAIQFSPNGLHLAMVTDDR